MADAPLKRQTIAQDRSVYLDVFIQVDGLVVDVVSHEEVVDAGQQRHLRQREDVHELLQGVAMGALRVTGHSGDRAQWGQRCSRGAVTHCDDTWGGPNGLVVKGAL